MFNYFDQLNASFEELMREVRAMRREMGRIRSLLEAERAGTGTSAVAEARTRSARPGRVE